MPLLFPFNDDITVVATHDPRANDLSARYFAFAEEHELPGSIWTMLRILHVEMNQTIREVRPNLSDGLAHSVGMVTIPQCADCRALYLSKHRCNRRTRRKRVVSFQSNRDAGAFGDWRAAQKAFRHSFDADAEWSSFG